MPSDSFSENIARGAMSWTATYPGRKEVPRSIAKACRACMNMARNECGNPGDFIDQACQINGIGTEEFRECVEALSDKPFLQSQKTTTIQISEENKERLRRFGFPIDAALSKVLDLAESLDSSQ